MKRIVFILVICLGCMGILGAQDNIWKPITCDTPLLGAASNGDLFAMAGYSGLLRSQDEGETWEQVNGNYMHQCIAFSPQGRIFVFPSSYTYLQYSDDGGDTWQQTTIMSSCAMNDVGGIYAVSNDTVVVWSLNGEMYYTLDGGMTWSFGSMELDEYHGVGDLIANESGDVYASKWYYSGEDSGIFHSTLSDMQNWELAAFDGAAIHQMEFDPEDNIVAGALWGSLGGFQHEPGFYLIDGQTIAVSDNGVVYHLRYNYSDCTAVLNYSTDHGEHFFDVGEELPTDNPAPGGGSGARIYKGHDNHLYFHGNNQYYKSVRNADHILENFPLENTAWVQFYRSMYEDSTYYQLGIKGDTVVNETAYKKVINCAHLGYPIEGECFGGIREDADGKCYFMSFVPGIYAPWPLHYDCEVNTEYPLYDFSLSVCDVFPTIGLTPLVVFDTTSMQLNGSTRKVLWFGTNCDNGNPYEWQWIEGIGSTHSLLYPIQCEPDNGPEYRLVEVWQDDEMIYRNSHFEEAPVTFAPQGAEWYFNEFDPWSQYPDYSRFYVSGDTVVQGHQCSVINTQFIQTGHGGKELVYEENNKVYWFNPSNNNFTILYDFDAEAGESWYCEVDSCSHLVTVESVGSETWNGHTYRTQWVKSYENDIEVFDGRIIEGIGYVKGLFPFNWACHGDIWFDYGELDYLRCYVVDGEILYHEGNYDCDWVYVNTFCWDGTVAEAYAGGDGTEENPYQIANAKQLALLAQQTNNGTGGDAYYKLTANINLERCTGGYNTWTSIGVPENDITPRYFTGHFDGGGNNIMNLYQRQDATFKGLFGCTNGAEIKNVNLVNCEIGNGAEYAGALVAYAGSTDISNCSVKNSQITTTGGVAGGIIGYAGMPFRIHETNENVSKITNCEIEFVIVESAVDAGGIVGKINDDSYYERYLVSNCSTSNGHYYIVKGCVAGGIVGEMRSGTVEGCTSNTIVVGTGQVSNVCVGGVVGSIHGFSVIANSYNRGNVVADFEFAGGIVGYSAGNVYNVYNAGEIVAQDPNSYGFGTIVGNDQGGTYLNCYWLENELPATGNYFLPEMSGSTSFHQGTTPKNWVLNEEQYGTTDLVEALNLGINDNYLWREDTNNTNDGFPIFVYIEPNSPIHGAEWYYEIQNDDGSITYQYLQHMSDTVIQDDPVQIIVKINTLYDKGEHIEKSYEYIFERDGKVYWWNKTLGEFTVLYDFDAEEGDEWEIKVGTASLMMHVDAVELYEYEGRQYKNLQVSDPENLFSGTIVCDIGHLTSFFPERLINKSEAYRVKGIRCFWQNGKLVFKYGDRDCDEVYEEFHDYSVEEPIVTEGFRIYPNPTDGIINVFGCQSTEYSITNLMGQTLMTGQINGERQSIDVSALPNGLYFITFAGETHKIVIK